MHILTAAEMAATDQRTIADHHIPMTTLMENAGTAVAHFILREFPLAQRITLLCGKGNNGGDGLVAARHLAQAGRQITVLLLGTADDLKPEPRQACEKLKNLTFGAAPTEITIESQLESVDPPDLFVDSIVGTGFKPPLRGLALAAKTLLNKHPTTPVLSIDLPSGWDADSRSFSSQDALRSDAVLTFTAPKLAHAFGQLTQGGSLTRPGNLQQGPIVVASIGSPPETIQSTTNLTWAGSSKTITDTPRNPDGNKGQYGHVLLIGGADGKAGAPAMASLACLRAGAGLVSTAIVASILPTVAAIAPELMTLPLLAGSTGAISRENLDPANLKHLLDKKSVIAIGPGLGEDPDAQDFVLGIIEQTRIPIVIDADALNAIAARNFNLDGRGRTIVLTPHPGEMARLLNKSIREVQADRENLARTYATTHHVTLVLKGWRTLIAHPDGRLAINTTGNPGLAKGGSGDILTGIVAALLAQYKETPDKAVEAAVYLHGLAADLAVAQQDQHTLLATDVIAHLWRAYRFRTSDEHGLTWLQGQPGRYTRSFK